MQYEQLVSSVNTSSMYMRVGYCFERIDIIHDVQMRCNGDVMTKVEDEEARRQSRTPLLENWTGVSTATECE